MKIKPIQKKTLLRIEATFYTILLVIMSTIWHQGLVSIGTDPNKTKALLLFFLMILGLTNFIWLDEPKNESAYDQTERHNMQLLTRGLMFGLTLLTFTNKFPGWIDHLLKLIEF